MHIHILGICGTFMGGIALIARAMGHSVTGSDEHVYPPMSSQLKQQGIKLMQGYEASHLDPAPDMVVVGNAMSRGNPAVEAMLNLGLPYTSGPQWLSEHLLADRWVLAVAGTHGKTTTASMLAWILEHAGLNPGFLIGGVPMNFGLSARAGEAPFFVVEADEYDTAFFDKRSKFVHYRPRTLVMNNLEFDHADIFDDLGQIQRQFHHLVRTVPGNGRIILPMDDDNLDAVIDMGCWTLLESLAADDEGDADWSVEHLAPDGSAFNVVVGGEDVGAVSWSLSGRHNVMNALAALAAARHAGVPPRVGVDALCRFENVRRRMELRGEVNGIRVYDDFAHHPTAIETTIQGLRAAMSQEQHEPEAQVEQKPRGRIIAILEPRSNTMRMGIHAKTLPESLSLADRVHVFVPESVDWDASTVLSGLAGRLRLHRETRSLIDRVIDEVQPGDAILVMSNGSFENIHDRLLEALS